MGRSKEKFKGRLSWRQRRAAGPLFVRLRGSAFALSPCAFVILGVFGDLVGNEIPDP